MVALAGVSITRPAQKQITKMQRSLYSYEGDNHSYLIQKQKVDSKGIGYLNEGLLLILLAGSTSGKVCMKPA